MRTNRPGIGLLSDTGYRIELYEGAQSPLLAGAHVEAGVVGQLSPASIHPGIYVQAVPVAPLLLRLQAQRYTFFGLFGAMVDYPSTEANWAPTHLRRRRQDAQFGGAWYGEARAQLRLKVGPVVSLSEARFAWLSADDIPEGHAWYEPGTDMLVAKQELMVIAKSTLGVLCSGELKRAFLVAGLHWERYHATRSDQLRHLAGLLGLWRPNLGWRGRPAFGLLAGALLVDPYRAGTPWFGGFINFSFGP